MTGTRSGVIALFPAYELIGEDLRSSYSVANPGLLRPLN